MAGPGKWFEQLLGSIRRCAGKPGDKPKGLKPDVLAAKIRKTDLFSKLPDENMAAMLSHMETVEAKAGADIIREGNEGDYYYLLVAGSAVVTKHESKAEKPQIIAELTGICGFGEEALISNAKRNATVTLTANSVLMRLSKNDFNEYVKEPLITWLSPALAHKRVAGGARWLDVREQAGYGLSRLSGAVVLPVTKLRESVADLDKNCSYVCYCDNGRLSSVAAFLLLQRKYDVAVLRGGLKGLERAGLV